MVMILPGSVIGILGGGQLGRMLAAAAGQLGYKCHIYSPDENSPAFDLAAYHTVADYNDIEALTAFAAKIDVATYEFENIPAAAAQLLAEHKVLRPSWHALEVSQDRVVEKDFLNEHGIATAAYQAFETKDELKAALAITGRPAIAKTRRFGYDGKGQATVKSKANFANALKVMGGVPSILEAFVGFDREISAIVARSENGDVAAFPISENSHVNHVLDETNVPAAISPTVMATAQVIATKIANALDYVGVLAVEMFVTDITGEVVVNEIAPRVHNSGHWTIEGAHTSQFEQHIRAICGLPLGDPSARGAVRMKNLLGKDILNIEEYLADPGAHFHHYGKCHPVDGRKMGHVTWIDPKTD